MCVLLGFLQKTWAIPIMNPLSWFMITVMYHSPNRWGESCKTAVTLIKVRFLTSIVDNQAGRCDDVPPYCSHLRY